MEALNKKQQAAVDLTDGAALVVAGAGTGKTRVIVERIIRLINDGIPASQILALTFTEKAAAEMLDRVSSRSLGQALDTTIATFNGFGNELLQSYGSEWGLGTVRLLGETGKIVFLRQHLDALGLDYFAPVSNPTGQLDSLAAYVSLLKQQLVEPQQYQRYAASLPVEDAADKLEKTKHLELASFYQTYLQLCRENQVIDYDDQIYLTIRLLQERPNIRRELAARYQYIMVDEFQDTNPMQSALVDLLGSEHQNVMVVGDDDQSIYGWRGATLANILEFTNRYPKAKPITLIDNYRSSQQILDTAYRLIQHNNPERLEVINKLDKRLQSQQANGLAPVAKHFYNLGAELTWVADDIGRRLKRGQDPNTIAVLARRSQTVQKVHETLELYDIPHAMAGLANDMYAQPVIKQLIEGLKAVSDPLDDAALFHTLSGPLFTIDSASLAEYAAVARREQGRLAAHIAADDSIAQAALATIAGWRSESAELSVGDLAYRMITESGWKQRLYEQSESHLAIATQVSALSQFFVTLKEFERIADIASVHNYLLSLPALLASGHDFEDATLEISDSLVNVLSVHRAKGLEWDTVYIIDCTEGSFPLHKRGTSLTIPTALKVVTSRADEHMAEERRLMYVAVTRARRELILSYADRHAGGGALRRPSRFLGELIAELPAGTEAESSETGLERFAPRTPDEHVALPASMQVDGQYVLSVSQIVCWLNCPRDFYYQYVLGMPVPDEPSRHYGTAIHLAIERIHEGRRADNPPSVHDLLRDVQEALPMRGYASAGSRERAHAQALQSVQQLYERFMQEPLPLEVEQSFSVRIPELPLKMIGRIDAVYQLENGVEIRDFKTSMSVTTPEKAKSRATASPQLTLYALAWRLLHDEMPALLSLDFVETGQIGTVRKQAKSLDTMQGKLATMVEQLQAGVYPLGKDHSYCKHPL